MDTLTPTDRMLDFVASRGADAYSRDTPWKMLNTWMNAADWCRAQHLYLDSVASMMGASGVRRYACDVHRMLRLNVSAPLVATDPALLERVERLAVLDAHGNADIQIHTFHHTSGAKAQGSRRELVAATGLSVQRVKDLIAGRRRFSKGWATTEGEAKRGRLPAGRKPMAAPTANEFFQDAGTPLF
ncbi:MAG: hypothetical protein O9289_17465 [Rhodobacteraceae bacterium]|nr:hypothetical protein [Paracoccaceae bacterium]MCZ8084990.1 hypothetical protein [Paracoccaceae bacterium]